MSRMRRMQDHAAPEKAADPPRPPAKRPLAEEELAKTTGGLDPWLHTARNQPHPGDPGDQGGHGDPGLP